jgi:putative heme-binding domain-containing protein
VVPLSETAKESLENLSRSLDDSIRSQALPLIALLGLESETQRQARVEKAMKQLGDVTLTVDERLVAVTVLAEDENPNATASLLNSLRSSTPRERDAILKAIFARRDRIPALLEAVEAKTVAAAWMSAVQKNALLESSDPAIRQRAASHFKSDGGANREMFSLYADALAKARDTLHGEQVFREKCANCHQAHGLGYAVGPDLNAEFQRAEETIIQDVLAPSASISAGYVTYNVLTKFDQVFSGLLSAESPTSITLRQAEGKEETILRKDVVELRAMSVSMMPDDLFKSIEPKDLADVLSWLRRPPTRLILLDENIAFASALSQGTGTAEFIATDKHDGRVSLKITPPQRHSPRIPGWSFRIRENPAAGEYRYIRFAWKSLEASGAMLEFADDGRWPPSNKPLRRYHAGTNTTGWQSVEVSQSPPRDWVVVTRDLWGDMGDFTLTGIAPTAMGAPVLFDRLELLQAIER